MRNDHLDDGRRLAALPLDRLGPGSIFRVGVAGDCIAIEYYCDELGINMTRAAHNKTLDACSLALLIVCTSCSQSPQTSLSGDSLMTIKVTSTAFKSGGEIPKQYTGDGSDQSPPLNWSKLPDATKSIALICDDPDAPRGTWVHWVLYDLPPETRDLKQGVPRSEALASGAKQGKNDFGKIGYGGPAPPKGKPHRYSFKVYALSENVDLAPGATKAQLVDAMKGRILAEGQLMGIYQR